MRTNIADLQQQFCVFQIYSNKFIMQVSWQTVCGKMWWNLNLKYLSPHKTNIWVRTVFLYRINTLNRRQFIDDKRECPNDNLNTWNFIINQSKQRPKQGREEQSIRSLLGPGPSWFATCKSHLRLHTAYCELRCVPISLPSLI